MKFRTAVACVLLSAALMSLHAEEPFNFRLKYIRDFNAENRSIVCPRVAAQPKFDGTFNDPIWQQASQTQSAFTLFPSKDVCGRQTIALFCHDDHAIYIGFDCEEAELDQQQIDNPNVRGSDHVGVHLEVGSNDGRGPRCNVFANRGGCQLSGPFKEQKVECKCAAGPKRWYVQLAIPFSSLPGSGTVPLPGEEWSVKLTRYGKMSDTGASRMRSAWPYIPTIVEDVTCYGATLYFDADSMLVNSALTAKDNTVPDWQVVSGKPSFAGGKLDSPAESVLTQNVKLSKGNKFMLRWTPPEGLSGSITVKVADKIAADMPLAAGRLNFQTAAADAATIEVHLTGSGIAPKIRLSRILDDVPGEWICLTNNDALPERNLNSKLPKAGEGKYIYLKCPLYNWDFAPYHSLGSPYAEEQASWDWSTIGRPVRKPLPAPPAHPEIAEDEYESFPFETTYSDGNLPEFVGLTMGSYDKGGEQGWIPFSKGSLTGDPSWAGWPVNRWISGTNNGQSIAANTHDILFDLPDKYFIRRIDILKINNGSFYNVDVSVRSSVDAQETFVPICKYSAVTPYAVIGGLDSVAKQVRLSLQGGAFENKFGRINAMTDLLGIAEIWIWAEPKGAHADTEVKAYHPPVPNQQPPLQCIQLKKWPDPLIWPEPKEMTKVEGRFELKPGAAIVFAGQGMIPRLAAMLQHELAQRFCTDIALKDEATFSGGDGCIYLGMKGVSKRFDEICSSENVTPPTDQQGYALKITSSRIIAAGCDAEGVLHACQTLAQWMDHDEHVAYAGNASIRDWPLLRLRTVVPSADHRTPILPFNMPESNFNKLIEGLSRLRFNSLIDWDPTTPYQSEARTIELIQYAGEHMVDLRPTLYLANVPGNCIEANPDDQPDAGGTGGIGGADGVWETANLCPSNPLTYKNMESYIDRALRTHNTSPFVEIGYMGSLQGPWNVCRLCRKRSISGEELYADFLNKIGTICRTRGKTAVFTNAIMFADAIRRAGNSRGGDALDSVNRALGMRMDRPVSAAAIAKSGFWTLSRPWATPAPVNNGGYAGGAAFFAGLPMEQPVEGAIAAGERCHYDGIWAWACSGHLLRGASEFWNGPSPVRGQVPEKDYSDYEQKFANACVRFNEQITRGFEYPSWRTGMTPKFFLLDLKPFCTRSHIDEGTASGLGHSGPREGLIASGSAFDFRRVPGGRQVFADVPFEILDPNANNWKSIVVIGDSQKQHLIPGSKSHVEIPIARKAASFCVLRCLLRKTNRIGDNRNWVHLTLPAFVFEYADGTRYVCDREQIRQTDAVNCPQCFQEGNDKEPMQQTSNQIGGTLQSFLWPAGRVAYCTNALGGGGTSLFLDEFVNPYPEKEVKNLVVQLPNPEQKEWTFGFHEAIFAVTGVESTEWDVNFWKRFEHREIQFPLLPANAVIPNDAKPIMAACEYASNGQEGSFLNKETKKPEVLTRPAPNGPVPTWQFQFLAGQTISAFNFRLAMPGHDSGPMPVRFRHTDVKLTVSTDGKTWTDLASVAGCTGMDGEHRITFTPVQAPYIQVSMDSSKYVDEDASAVGPISWDFYGTPGK
jgi:hypothetical protein